MSWSAARQVSHRDSLRHRACVISEPTAEKLEGSLRALASSASSGEAAHVGARVKGAARLAMVFTGQVKHP